MPNFPKYRRCLSQEAGIAEPRPVESGGHGHGCGHNLLGSSALLAATAVKDWLVANKVPGRVRYYGCPAEEGGAAKAFMVRCGAFEDADIAIKGVVDRRDREGGARLPEGGMDLLGRRVGSIVGQVIENREAGPG